MFLNTTTKYTDILINFFGVFRLFRGLIKMAEIRTRPKKNSVEGRLWFDVIKI